MLFSFLSRPAGIRTMSLVSLGSCLFTITSTFAFLHGPMTWDASRVSAAIPSGVGFLGAGLIFKKEQHNSDGSDSTPMVHGLTTAASLWLSAAVGIACGGELYFAASFGTATMILLLRFGPRGDDSKHDDSDDEQETLELFQNADESKSLVRNLSMQAKEKKLRQRANLASIV
jgi:putative Mg2+ transporter-C (MgtC) family protein